MRHTIKPSIKPSQHLTAKLFATVQHLIPQQTLSKVAGQLASSRHAMLKKVLIHGFANAYDIELDEYQRQSLSQYDSFNDFFTRELTQDARPIDDSTNGIACPADGVVSALGHMNKQQILQAKGRDYSVAQLLANLDDGQYFADGSFATVYLAPSNYHRVHMPLNGRLLKTRYVPGTLFSVNDATAQNVPDVFARNERLVCVFETTFVHGQTGRFAVVMVGAMIVAGIETVATGKIVRSNHVQELNHDIMLNKGDELGRFYLGSTAIVLMPKQAGVMWQADIHQGSVVKMGQKMGDKLKSPSTPSAP